MTRPGRDRHLTKLISTNLIILLGSSYALGSLYSLGKYGDFNLNRAKRLQLLSPGTCKGASCRGFTDFNTAKESWVTRGDETPCLMSNPIFGYTNTCTKGKLGLSKETDKKKSDRTIRLLVVGGSQANIMTPQIENSLKTYIRENKPHLQAEVFGAALGGAKQPMQTQTVNALMALGYEFDAIVNINGWNEIVLATLENEINGISTIYPRGHLDRLFLQQRALLAGSGDNEASIFEKILDWHPIWNAYKYESKKQETLSLASKRHRLTAAQEGSFFIARLKLDPFPALSQTERLQEAESIWRNSSRSLMAMSSAAGVEYLEVIQPSLDHHNSKRFLTDSEKRMKCKSGKPANILSKTYAKPTSEITGTPKTNTLDARYIFAEESRTTYTDCVHLNETGSKLLSLAIIQRLENLNIFQ